jgi:outer membrane protein TolC
MKFLFPFKNKDTRMKFLKALAIMLPLAVSGHFSYAQEARTMTLKDCIRFGLEHHPSVQVYQNNIRGAGETARESLAGYLPQVTLNAGMDDNLKLPETIIPAGTFGPGTPEQRVAFGNQYNNSASVQLDQKIYDQSLLSGLKARQPNKDLARLQAQQNDEGLIYNIASSYYQILVAQKQLDLLQSNKERFETILKVTKLQAEQGVVKKVDIKQVQVNLNNVLAQISEVNNNLALARNTLKNNMGLSQEAKIILTDTGRWLGETPQAKDYPEFDFTRSLNYQIQKTQIKLYDINRKMYRDKIYPTLSLYARYGANTYGQEFDNSFSPYLDFSTVGLKLSWNIFTGFRRDAQYKEAIIDVENARLNLQLYEANQSLQFQNADAQVTRAQITIRTNKSNMELANEVYDNTTLQYRQGMASLSDLLNAELSYREAQNNYINSLLDYYLADLDVQKANGTLENYYKQL